MSVLNNRIQFTAGVRQQYVASRSFSAVTGQQTAGYDTRRRLPPMRWWSSRSRTSRSTQTISRGSKSGTVVPEQYANRGQVLPPYRTRQYEAGVKVDWGRITTTASAFDITKPFQIVDTCHKYADPGGENRNRGVEMNVFGELTPGTRLLGGVMFIDARQAEDPGRYIRRLTAVSKFPTRN